MLKIKPECECCNTDLTADATGAMTCFFECTCCRACAEKNFNLICPTWVGELVGPFVIPAEKWLIFPVSSERFVKEHSECTGLQY